MAIDIVSYLMGKAAGGGGGGGDAFVSPNAPTSADGENGQYWFQLNAEADHPALVSQPSSVAYTGTAGWEFKARKAITVAGLRAKIRNSNGYTGTIKLTTSNGTTIAEVSVSLVEGEWVDAYFDDPVSLTVGSNYIVMLFGESGTLTYQNNPTTVSDVEYVCGRYGGLPGVSESGTCYSCDIIIQGHSQPPLPVKTQYYKSGDSWSVVT